MFNSFAFRGKCLDLHFCSKELQLGQNKYIISSSIIAIFLSILLPKTLGLINGHHGWVTAEQLAIVLNSTYENWFVGYTINLEGTPTYFTKAPFILNFILHNLIGHFSQPSTQLIATRLVMDCTFILSMFLMFKLLAKLTGKKQLSFIAVVIGFSGYSAAYYRDLIVPDNFLLLSFICSGLGIYYYKQNQNRISNLSPFKNFSRHIVDFPLVQYLHRADQLYGKLSVLQQICPIQQAILHRAHKSVPDALDMFLPTQMLHPIPLLRPVT